MKKNRIVSLICVLFVSLFLFAACDRKEMIQAPPNITDAEIIEVVKLTLDLNKINVDEKTGVADVKNLIKSDANKVFQQMYINLYEKINKQLLNPELDQEEKDILLSYKNSIALKDLNFKLVDDKIEYEFCLKYKNIGVYKYIYNEKGEDAKVVVKEELFFYNKMQIVGDEVSLKYFGFTEECKKFIDLAYSQVVTKFDSYMVYNLETTKRRLNTNSDYSMQLNSGNYLHTWIVDENAEDEIEYYYNVANNASWIICALAVTIFITIILFAIAVNLKPKNNSEKISFNLIRKLINKNSEKINKK